MKKLRSLFALFLAGLLTSLLLANSVLALNSTMLNFGDQRSANDATQPAQSNREQQIIAFRRSSSRRKYLQELEKADRFYQQGNLSAVATIHKQVKEAFANTGSGRRKPIDDPAKLSGGASVYYREGKSGLEQSLVTKAFISLQKLSEDYPQFIPGHLMLAEAARKFSDEDAKTILKKSKVDVELEALERGSSIFPERKDLLDARIKAFANYDKFIEASVTARQFALLFPKDPASSKYLSLAEEYLDKHRRSIRERILGLAVAGSLFGKLGGNNDTSAQIIALLSQSESEFGAQAAQKLKEKMELVSDPDLVAYVDRIGQKVAKTMGRNEFSYEFNVYKNDDEINAFALPGGKIFIASGILKLMGTEAELAGLLGHEVGHAVLSHGYIKTVESLAAGAVGDVFGIGAILEGQLAANSRGAEKQSDILGTRSIVSAGYSADGVWNVMRLLKLHQSEDGDKVNYLASHPSPSDRVGYLEEFIENNSFNRFAYEGVSEYKLRQKRLEGSSSSDKPSIEKNPAASRIQSNSDGNQVQSRNRDTRDENNNPSVGDSICKSGKVPVSAKIEKQRVAVSIDGGFVANGCSSFTVKLRIKNDSDRSFTFVPGFVQVLDSNDEVLKSRVTFRDGQKPTVEPGQAIEPRIQVFKHRWRNDGKQNLTIELKEGSSVARVFRVAF
ncbi:MAG: M48 family metallopeptidase [Pseudanabaena sp. ELA645]|jgi:archaellum component FlaG (FlaF/FlaG flagellin family)